MTFQSLKYNRHKLCLTVFQLSQLTVKTFSPAEQFTAAVKLNNKTADKEKTNNINSKNLTMPKLPYV